MKKQYTRKQIQEAIAYWEGQLGEIRKRTLNESQSAAAKKNILDAAFGDAAPAGKVVIVLKTHFMRNGNNCYDVLYTTDTPFRLEIVGSTYFDRDRQSVVFKCADANNQTNPDAASYREIAITAAANGFQVSRCRKAELKLGYASVDILDPKTQIEFNGKTLTVTYDDEFWVTDNWFFEKWSDQLWDDDIWDSSKTRDEEGAFDDICGKFLRMLDREQWTAFCERAGLDGDNPVAVDEIMDNPDAYDLLQDIYSRCPNDPLHLPGRAQLTQDRKMARNMV